MAHPFNPSTGEAGAGGFYIERIAGRPELGPRSHKNAQRVRNKGKQQHGYDAGRREDALKRETYSPPYPIRLLRQ